MAYNILHQFRSYSYHHILIACNTTQVADYIAGLSGGAVFQEILTQRGPGGRSSNEDGSDEDGVIIKSAPGGEYAIVYNGMTDADFYITACEWETWITPEYAKTQSTERDFVTTVSTTGTMVMMEPRGFRFLNVINNVIRGLRSGTMGTIFILKTVFVGHNDQGVAGQTYVSDIRPLQLAITNIVARFDEGGSRYDIEFVGQANGIGKAPQYSQLSLNSLTVSSEKSTLVDAIQTLASTLNDLYNEKVEKHINNGVSQLEGQRRIKYEIILDDEYKKPIYIVDKMLTTQNGNGKSTGGTVNYGNTTNIEQMIRDTMMRSSAVMKAAESKPNKIFKIYTTVESTLDEVQTRFYVKPFTVPEVTDASGTELIDGVDFDLLEYDYIYTGKNTDILDMKMNMELGFAFFQLLESVEPLTEDQSVNGTVMKADGSRSVGGPNHIKDLTPVHPPIPKQNLKDRGVKNPLSTNAFLVALNKFAEIETLENTFTIHGNPSLLNSFNTQPSEFANNQTGSGLLSRWHSVPSLCKINVSMPSNNSLLGVGPSDQFQTPFWYQGLYLILFVKHKFIRGEFTQEITMKNVPVADNPAGAFEYDEKNQYKPKA